MSHTWVLDKIGRPFVNFAAGLLFGGEHCQKRHFDGEGFVNVATEMIAQFFEAADAFQDFSGAEARCECGSFVFCSNFTSFSSSSLLWRCPFGASGIAMHLERIVSGKASGKALSRSSNESFGGSSNVLRNAFAASV